MAVPSEEEEASTAVGQTDGYWTEITESEFVWEREALAFLRERLPRHEPYRAWSNFEFTADDGSIYEVDLLLLSRKGFFLVEIKSQPGVLTGDAGTWTWRHAGRKKVVDNPRLLANRKAKKLASLLRRQKALKNHRKSLPFLTAAVFLSATDLHADLDPAARKHVYSRDRDATTSKGLGGLPGFCAALLRVGIGAHDRLDRRIDRPLAKALGRALDQAGIRRSTAERRVADYELGELVFEGPGYQDYVARHRSAKGVTRRVRVFSVNKHDLTTDRETVARAARREFELLDGVQHPGILKAEQYTDSARGPALLFAHDPSARRLDHVLEEEGDSLSLGDRLDLVRQVGEALCFAHAKRLVHRALSPQSVLVRRDAKKRLRAKIFNWQVAAREIESEGSTARSRLGTCHPQALVESAALVYVAPEVMIRGGEADEAMDVFSLGALSYFIFSGRAPASTPLELLTKLREKNGLDLGEVVDGANETLVELIRLSTAPAPPHRLDSAKLFLAELDTAEDELTRPEVETVDPARAGAGDVLPGGFQVLQRLGQGATAVAFLVERDGARRILKLARSLEQNDVVRDEAEVLKQLRHPAIVAYRGLVEVGQHLGLLTDAVLVDRRPDPVRPAGFVETLRDRLRKDGRLSQDLLLRFGTDLLEAVAHLEDRGLPHRDIKPDNLAVGPAGRDKTLHLFLFDFSLSRAPAEQIRAGTPGYLEPFLVDRRRWDVHAERFSVAVTLYEMATGTLPRWGDGRTDPALLSEEATIESDLFQSGLRRPLQGFFRKALRRKIERRFDNARDMLRAWQEVFREGEAESPVSNGHAVGALAGALEGATPRTPLAALPLSTRVQEALERLNALTIADALSLPATRVASMRGVGNQTRRDLLEVIRALAAKVEPPRAGLRAGREAAARAPARSPAAAAGASSTGSKRSDEATSLEEWSLDRVAEGLIPRGEKGRPSPKRDRALRLLLGLEPVPGAGPRTWPSQTEVAGVVGGHQPQVARYLAAARKRWLKRPELTAVRADLIEVLRGLGGVAAVREIEGALRALRRRDLPPGAEPSAGDIQAARAVVRAAIEAESALGEPRVLTQRRGDRVLVALDGPAGEGTAGQARLDYARRLGESADILSGLDPLPISARVERELRGVSAPARLEPLSTERLVRLAAVASKRSAASSRLELYPRGLSAERALRLARGSLLGAASLGAEAVRARVRARYPEASPLPPRPELDRLLQELHLDLRWVESEGCYRVPTAVPTGLSSVTLPPVRRPTAVGRAVSITPEVADARLLEERLERAARDGGQLLLVVEPSQVAPAASGDGLLRFGLARVSFDRLLLAQLRRVAKERSIRWERVLAADAAGPSGPRWGNLRRLVGEALPRVEEELYQVEGGVLLTEIGLLARYDRLDVLDRLRERLGVRGGGRGVALRALRALWVLIPQDGQAERPMLNGKAVPVLTGAEWTRLSWAWLENRHRSSAA